MNYKYAKSNVHGGYAFIIHLVRLIRIVSQSDRESRTMHMYIYIYIVYHIRIQSQSGTMYSGRGVTTNSERERIARRSMIQRYTRAIRAHDRVWHSQNLATAIRDSVCQTLDPFSQSREPPGHSRYRDDSIDFNRTPPRYWSSILSGRRRISSSRILFRLRTLFRRNVDISLSCLIYLTASLSLIVGVRSRKWKRESFDGWKVDL